MSRLDDLWAELLLDACASDGPIRDNDVRQAIARYRPRIEDEAASPVPAPTLDDHLTVPHGWITYDAKERWLVETDKVGGASQIVGSNVPEWFGRLVVARLATPDTETAE